MPEDTELAYLQEKLVRINRKIKYAWLLSLLGTGLIITSYVFESSISDARTLEILGVAVICVGVIVSVFYGTFQKNKLIERLETERSSENKANAHT